MKNIDIARDSFDPLKNFTRVLKQQGRVELEADWNEQTAITLRCMRLMMHDLVGPHGGPQDDCGFRVLVKGDDTADYLAKELLEDCLAGDFVLARGRYYVNGMMCENHAAFLYSDQPAGTCETLGEVQKHRTHDGAVDIDLQSHVHLIYLDVWEREVTALEDDSIREVALGGADTGARMQIAWRVRSVAIKRYEEGKETNNTSEKTLVPSWDDHVRSFQSAQRGAISARTRPTGIDAEPAADGGGYRGLENQLYRVEIHRGGTAGMQGATFKWSRDNGTVAFAVENLAEGGNSIEVTLATAGRDDTSTLSVGDLVEFNDLAGDDHDLAGLLFEVVVADMPKRLVTLRKPAARHAKAEPTTPGETDRRLILRRWDHAPGARRKGELAYFEGAALIQENRWLPLEDGIEIEFEMSTPGAPHRYRVGDYWLIPARTVTADVDWPQGTKGPRPMPPAGVEHHYAPLAIVDVTGGETKRLAPLTRRFGYHALRALGRDVLARDGD